MNSLRPGRSLDRFREAELALLNAPFEAEGWIRAIDRVAHAAGASSANLVCLGGPVAPSLNLFTGRDDDRARRCFERPELWGPCNWRVNSSSAPMTIQHERHYLAYRETADTADYDDAVSDLDMQFGCQSVLIRDERLFLGLAVFRGRREGPCHAESLEGFARLLRPLQRALRMQLALSAQVAGLIVGNLAAMDSPVVLIDRHGSVAGMTPAAEHLAEAGGPIRLSCLQFELSDRAQNVRMQTALARLLSEQCETGGSSVHEVRVSDSRLGPCTWVARAFRLPQRGLCLGFNPHVAITFEKLSHSRSSPGAGG